MTGGDGRTGRRLLVLALVLATAGMAPLMSGPWEHSWLGHNGARYAHIARNYARLGLDHLGGTPLMDTAGATAAAPEVYAHHPPGVPMLVGLVFAVAGVGETAARTVPFAATLISLVLLYLLVAGAAGRRAGGLAAVLAASLPMTTVFGTHVEVQGPPVLAAGLAVLLAYRHWLRGGSLLPWLALSVLASWFDWYGLYAPAGCALHLLLTRPRRWRAALGLGGTVVGLFLGWLVWLGSRPTMSVGTVLDAAGVRTPGALGLSGLVARHWGPFWRDGLLLMPGWPLLVVLALAIVAGRPRRALQPAADEPAPAVGPRAVVALLVLPPLVHGALFPAGMLVHSYWLFGLPLGLAAAVAVALRPVRPGLALGLVLLLCGLGWALRPLAVPPADPLPALVGQELARHTAPGDLILTNYDVNVLVPGAPGDAHVVMRPEVTFYADRPVRGGIGAPLPEGGPGRVDLGQALARRPDARWFLLVPWPAPPDPALAAAVRAAADGPGLELSADPLVWLYRLQS